MHDCICASRGQVLAVGRPGDSQRAIRVITGRWDRVAAQQLAGRGPPHLHGLHLLLVTQITCRRGEARPAGRPGDRPEWGSLTTIRQHLTLTPGIPHVDGAILTGRGERRRWPLAASQTCTVSSLHADAMRVPSGDQATANTALVCPCYVLTITGRGLDAVHVGAGRRGAMAQPATTRTTTNRTKQSPHQRIARERACMGRIMLASS